MPRTFSTPFLLNPFLWWVFISLADFPLRLRYHIHQSCMQYKLASAKTRFPLRVIKWHGNDRPADCYLLLYAEDTIAVNTAHEHVMFVFIVYIIMLACK